MLDAQDDDGVLTAAHILIKAIVVMMYLMH